MKNLTIKRLVAAVLVAMLSMSCVSFSLAEEEVVLEWFVDDTNSAYAYPARDTLVEKVIYEKTGLRVNMTFAATGDHAQLNNKIAAENMPDILTFGIYSNEPDMLMNQMIEGDMLYSFSELDGLAPGLLAACRQDVLKWWSSADGETYGYPNSAYSDVDTVNNPRARQPLSPISMRRDLWEQLGCPDISTPDGFLDACKRAQDEIGQYNGYDIIGLQCYAGVTGSIDLIAQYFSVPFENPDGTYSYAIDQPLYREVLAFFNKAYRMGVLWESNFSDQADTVSEHVAQGRTFANIVNPSTIGNSGMIPLYKTDNSATFFLPVLKNSLGEDPMLVDATSWGSMPTSVLKTSKHAKEAAELLTFLISDEGQKLLFTGVEGETHYIDENGKIVTNFDSSKAKELGLNTMFPLRNYNYYASLIPFSKDTYTKGYINKSDMLDYSYSRKALFKSSPETLAMQAEMNELSSVVWGYVNSRWGAIITAETEEEFNALYDEMLATAEKLGLSKLREYDNLGFQNAKKALGVKHLWPRYNEEE